MAAALRHESIRLGPVVDGWFGVPLANNWRTGSRGNRAFVSSQALPQPGGFDGFDRSANSSQLHRPRPSWIVEHLEKAALDLDPATSSASSKEAPGLTT